MVLAVKITLALYSIALLTSMAAMELFGWLSGLLGLVYFIKNRNNTENFIRFPKFKDLGLVWGFFLVVVVGAFFNQANISPGVIIGEARWVILLTLLVLTFQILPIETYENFYKYILIVGGLVGAYSFVQHFYGYDLLREPESYKIHASHYPSGRMFWRTRGFFSHPLTYAYSLGIFACFPFATVLSDKFKTNKKLWTLALVTSLLVSASIVTTYSRGGWLALAAGLMLVVYFRLNLKWSLIVTTLGGVFVGLVMMISPLIRTRFLSIFDFANGKHSERFNLWHANWEMFKDNPLVGVGYNLNKKVIEPYLLRLDYSNEFVSHAHNIFFQLLGGTGALGIIFIYSFMVLVCVHAIKGYLQTNDSWMKSILLAALASQICLHIGGLTESNFVDGEVNHLVVFIWAFIVSVYIKTLKSENQSVA